ncbi:MAG: hypothetical protein IPH45_04795 [Bacteroidales bacterium]|nr:hypothetical protein [Bacteroidales bacterium]MBK7171691.1 hypothetical protein [Bacteroidales bacterium]
MKEMAKSILSRLSCDKDLFNKELRKLIMWMGNNTEEIEELKKWSHQYFPNIYQESSTKIHSETMAHPATQE